MDGQQLAFGEEAAVLAPLPSRFSPIADSGLPPEVRLVALTLDLYTNGFGDLTMPSVAELVADTGLPEQTVRAALETLHREGYFDG